MCADWNRLATAMLGLHLVSCSDDTSTSHVDAAACVYPVPVTVQDTRADQTGRAIYAGVECPPRTMLLGGGCEAADSGAPSLLRLYDAGRRFPPGPSYACDWDNPDNATVTVTAWATCLPIQ